MFQELVLQEICAILCHDNEFPKSAEPPKDRKIWLAQLVYVYFLNKQFTTRLKKPDRLCHIIDDQSRYMATGSPQLEDIIKDKDILKGKVKHYGRNFVSERTAERIYEAVRHGLCLIDYETDLQRIIHKCKTHFPCSLNEAEDCQPLLRYPIESKDLRPHLNSLHHAILVGITYDLMGNDCPRVNRRLWFVDENNRNINLYDHLHQLAKILIDKLIDAKKARDNNLITIECMK